MSGRIARVAGALLLLALAGCGGHDDVRPPDLPATVAAGPVNADALARPAWDVVLAVGDEPLDTGDTLARALAGRWTESGVPIERLHRLSAADSDAPARPGAGDRAGGDQRDRPSRGRPDETETNRAEPDRADDLASVLPKRRGRIRPGDVLPATEGRVLREIATLGGGHQDACFVYLAGSADGTAIKLADGAIDQDRLDRALGAKCGSAPTVLVASGCGTGFLTGPPVARPNRLVIAASPVGGSGFGCGPNQGLTTFEECLLASLDGRPTWREIADAVQACVVRRTRLAGQPELTPPVAVGADIGGLVAPWPRLAHGIDFRRGIGRLAIDDAPFYPALKRLTRPAFEAYLRAPNPKALALTLAGTVIWVASKRGESPDDVARLALERCEYQSAGACILYAVDDAVAAADNAGVLPIHPPFLVRAGRVEPATVPFIRDDQRAALAGYSAIAGAKALAVAPEGEAAAIGTGADQAAADRSALDRCRAESGGACVLYGAGDRVVLAAP